MDFKTKFIEELESQGFILVETSDKLDELYPEKEHGKYRPQPWHTPDDYPCLIKQEGIIDNPYGADDVILSIVYLPEAEPCSKKS